MPVHFRIGQITIVLQMLTHLLYPLLAFEGFEWGMGTSIQWLIYTITAIGLVRQVAWGRFLSSCFGVMLALGVASLLTPDMDCNQDEWCRHPLAHMLGYEPSLLTNWVVVMLAALFYLIPQAMVGWKKTYFQNKL